MFRLTATPPRHARLLLTRSLPPFSAPPALKGAAAATGRRTLLLLRPKKISKFVRAKQEKEYEEILAKKEKALAEWKWEQKLARQAVVHERPLSEFEMHFKMSERRSGNPKEFHKIYSSYLSHLVGRNENPNWQEFFMMENRITPAALHETAEFISSFRGLRRADWQLVCDMFNSAAALGYGVSALSLIKFLLHVNHSSTSDFYWGSRDWEKSRNIVEKIARENRNPNALVVQGLLFLARGGADADKKALAAFSRAEELSEHTTNFEWRKTCWEKQGEIFIRLGDEDSAENCFREMMEWDYAEGFYHMAMLRPDHPERHHWLVKAALSRITKAYEPLMLHCLKESEKLATVDPELAAQWRQDAEEWDRLNKFHKTKLQQDRAERRKREEEEYMRHREEAKQREKAKEKKSEK